MIDEIEGSWMWKACNIWLILEEMAGPRVQKIPDGSDSSMAEAELCLLRGDVGCMNDNAL